MSFIFGQLLLSYPRSSPTQVRHLPQKLWTGNIDTETNGTNTNNDEVQLYQERLLCRGFNVVQKCK